MIEIKETSKIVCFSFKKTNDGTNCFEFWPGEWNKNCEKIRKNSRSIIRNKKKKWSRYKLKQKQLSRCATATNTDMRTINIRTQYHFLRDKCSFFLGFFPFIFILCRYFLCLNLFISYFYLYLITILAPLNHHAKMAHTFVRFLDKSQNYTTHITHDQTRQPNISKNINAAENKRWISCSLACDWKKKTFTTQGTSQPANDFKCGKKKHIENDGKI